MRGILAALLIAGFALQVGPVGAAASGSGAKTASSKSSGAKTTKAKPKQKAKQVKGNSKADTSKNKSAKPSPPAKPAEKPQEPSSSPKKDSSESAPATVPDDTYTSLVIDATGFKLDKVMGPKILRLDGSEVWGTLKNLKDEDYTMLEERGMVGYVTTIEDARANSRCGPRPLIVKATDTQGSRLRSDPAVSDEDAELILAENAKGKFLEKFNVIFIKNENPAPPTATPDGDQSSPSPPSDPQPPTPNPKPPSPEKPPCGEGSVPPEE